MQGERSHSRGYLPHIVKPGGSYFVTFRLADSLPRKFLVELESELNEMEAGFRKTWREAMGQARRQECPRYMRSRGRGGGGLRCFWIVGRGLVG